MSMTREEAIAEIKYYMEHDSYADAPSNEACQMAINALRPVSRDQVEQMWPGCDYCKHAWIEGLDLKPCANGNIGVELVIGRISKDDAFGILAYYRNAAAGYIDFPFCPFCGRPMTDEAVRVRLKELEALHGKENP